MVVLRLHLQWHVTKNNNVFHVPADLHHQKLIPLAVTCLHQSFSTLDLTPTCMIIAYLFNSNQLKESVSEDHDVDLPKLVKQLFFITCPYIICLFYYSIRLGLRFRLPLFQAGRRQILYDSWVSSDLLLIFYLFELRHFGIHSA